MPKIVQIVTILIGADPTTSLTRVKSWPSIPCVVRVPSQFMAYTFDDHSLKKNGVSRNETQMGFSSVTVRRKSKAFPVAPVIHSPVQAPQMFPIMVSALHC